MQNRFRLYRKLYLLKITDFDTFKAFEDKHYQQTEPDGSVDMDTEALIWQIIDNTNYFILQSLSDFMETYDSLADNIPPNLNYDGSSYEKLYEQKMARIENLKSRPAMYGYLPSSVLEATNEYAKCFITWSVLSVILLLSPTLVRDRLHRIRSTQWSSRYGRRILKPQMTAALLSALLLTGLNYLAYALPLLTKQALIFKDFGLFSIIGFAHPWFDWSYGNHLLILSIMSFVLTLAAAGITLFLSQYSGNYVSMLFKALPLFIILELLYTNCFIDRAFMFANPLSERLHLPGAEAICSVMLALISIVLCLLACRKQLKREL